MKVFELLHLEAKRNVETFNAASPQHEQWDFAASNNVFSVVQRQFSGFVGMRFTLVQDEIAIEGEGVSLRMIATLTLNDEGDCRLRVNDETLDRWQVLRRALEPLFFSARRR